MPKIDVKIAETKPEPYAGLVAKITNAEVIETQRQHFNGIRVSLVDKEGNEYATMLWLRDTVGQRSKLGAFITALGDDTDEWIGKWIRFVSWDRNAR